MEKELHIVVRTDGADYHNALVGANGETVMHSETYATKTVAIREAKKLAEYLNIRAEDEPAAGEPTIYYTPTDKPPPRETML